MVLLGLDSDVLFDETTFLRESFLGLDLVNESGRLRVYPAMVAIIPLASNMYNEYLTWMQSGKPKSSVG